MSDSKIILASTSKIRCQILQESKIKFTISSPLCDEESEKKKFKSLSIKSLAVKLATIKALSVSKNFPNSFVIASDQICEFENRAISKAKNHSEILKQLKMFSGKIHFQNNATVVAKNNKIIFKNFVRSKLKMRKMTEEEILKYIKIDNPIGCAGSYKYESLGKHLFEKVSGDYFSILGLSIQPLLAFFYKKQIIKL